VEFPENDDTLLPQAQWRHQQSRPDCVDKATPHVSMEDSVAKKRESDGQYNKDKRSKALYSKPCECGGR
jgi:hypothetical protein